MEIIKFRYLIKGKSTNALLGLYDTIKKSTNRRTDPVFVAALDKEIATRNLTEDEEDYYVALHPNIYREDGEEGEEAKAKFSRQEMAAILRNEWGGRALNRNDSWYKNSDRLQAVAALIFTFGILTTFYFLSQNQLMDGFITILVSLVTYILFRAFAKLILLLIEIEHNTRNN